MTTQPFEKIAGFYNGLVQQHGHDPRACDYGRMESQVAKFKVLAEVGNLSGKHILDVGCGFADYADYLNTHYRPASYTGIDLSDKMIEMARNLHPDTDLYVSNLLTMGGEKKYDVVNANGIFYLLGDGAESLMKKLIIKMFEISNLAVSFNSLSNWAFHLEPGEFYADPARTLDFCRSLSPSVTIRHDYLPHDFTVFLYKIPPAKW